MSTTPVRSEASPSPQSDKSSHKSPFASLKRFKRSPQLSASPSASENAFQLAGGSPSLRPSSSRLALRSPAKIPTPPKQLSQTGKGGLTVHASCSTGSYTVNQPRRILGKRPSQIEGLGRGMLFKEASNQSMAATAPARERKSKHFDLSSWQSHLPEVEPVSSPICSSRFLSMTSPIRPSDTSGDLSSTWSASPSRRPAKTTGGRSRVPSVSRSDFNRLSNTVMPSRLARSVPVSQGLFESTNKNREANEQPLKQRPRTLSRASESLSPFLATPKHQRSFSTASLYSKPKAFAPDSTVIPGVNPPEPIYNFASSPITAGKKRNANGAIVNASRRGGSMLGANSPITARPESSPYSLRDTSPSLFESDAESGDESMEIEGAVDASPLSPWRSASPPPALTDSSSITSSFASSNSLNASLSSHAGSMGSRRVSEDASIAALLNDSSAAFFTPTHYKDVKPLQAAFASSGLINKQTKARDSGVAFDSPLFKVEHAPQYNALPLIKPMPNTPCKPSTSTHLQTAGPTSVVEVGSLPLQNDSPNGMSSGESEQGSAVKKPMPSPRVSALRRIGAPAFRRRSSGQLNAELGFYNSNSGDRQTNSVQDQADYEPMTPTRTTKNGLLVNLPALTNTVTQSPLSPISPIPCIMPAPFCTTPTGQTFPLSAPGSADSIRSTKPLSAVPSRPNFKHRHSSSTLVTVRQHELQQPDRFDSNFVVLRDLGKGISSDAVAVASRQDGQVSAVKRTKQAFGGPKDRLRKYEEVAILRTLSRSMPSPWTIHFIDAWEQNGHLYIQTELCERGNLADFLNQHGAMYERLDEPRSWKIATQLALGLSFIHSHDVIHLDIKPANIFVTETGDLKYGDFGLASQWPRVSTFEIMEAAAIGTSSWPSLTDAAKTDGRSKRSDGPAEDLEREGDREYIAPEVLQGVYGKAADVFSLGLTLLEVATNIVVPDNGSAWSKLRSNDFTDVDADLQTGILPFVIGMLEADQHKRPAIDTLLALEPFQNVAQLLGFTNGPQLLTGALLPEPETSPLVAMFNISDSMVID